MSATMIAVWSHSSGMALIATANGRPSSAPTVPGATGERPSQSPVAKITAGLRQALADTCRLPPSSVLVAAESLSARVWPLMA